LQAAQIFSIFGIDKSKKLLYTITVI